MKRSLWVRLIAFVLMAAVLCMMAASCADYGNPVIPLPDGELPGGEGGGTGNTPGGNTGGDETDPEKALKLAAIRALAELLKKNGAGEDSRISMAVAAAVVASMLGEKTEWSDDLFEGEFALADADSATKQALYEALFEALVDIALDADIQAGDLTINQNGVSYTVSAEAVEKLLASLKDADWRAVAEKYGKLLWEDRGNIDENEMILLAVRALVAFVDYMTANAPEPPTEDRDYVNPDYAKKDGDTLTPVWVDKDPTAAALKADTDAKEAAVMEALRNGTADEIVAALRAYVVSMQAAENAGYYTEYWLNVEYDYMQGEDPGDPILTVTKVMSRADEYTELLRILDTYTAEGGLAGLLREALPYILTIDMTARVYETTGWDIRLTAPIDWKLILHGEKRSEADFADYVEDVQNRYYVRNAGLVIGEPYQDADSGEWRADVTSPDATGIYVSVADFNEAHELFRSMGYGTISSSPNEIYTEPDVDLMPLTQKIAALLLAFDGGFDYDAVKTALDALCAYLVADESGYIYAFELSDIELGDADDLLAHAYLLYSFLETLRPADTDPIEEVVGIDVRFGGLMASLFGLYKTDANGDLVLDDEDNPIIDEAAVADFAAILRAALRYAVLGEEPTVGDKTGADAMLALVGTAIARIGLDVNDLVTGDYEKFVADLIENVPMCDPDMICLPLIAKVLLEMGIPEDNVKTIASAIYAPIQKHIVGALRYPTDPDTGEKTGERFTGLAAIQWNLFAADLAQSLAGLADLPETLQEPVNAFIAAVREGTPGAVSDLLAAVLPLIPLQEYKNVAPDGEEPHYEYVVVEEPTEEQAALYAALRDAVIAAVRVLEVGEPMTDEAAEGDEVPAVDMLPYLRAIADAWVALAEEQAGPEDDPHSRYVGFGIEVPYMALFAAKQALRLAAEPTPDTMLDILKDLTGMEADQLVAALAGMLYGQFFDAENPDQVKMAEITRLLGVLAARLFAAEPKEAEIALAAADLSDYIAANMTKAPAVNEEMTEEEAILFWRGALTLFSITLLANSGADIDYNARYADLPTAEGAARPDYNALAEMLAGRSPVLTLADPAVEQRMTGATVTVRVRLACDLLLASVNAELTLTFDITY